MGPRHIPTYGLTEAVVSSLLVEGAVALCKRWRRECLYLGISDDKSRAMV